MNLISQRITHGKIRHWNDEKAFGFIESLNVSGEGLFVHIDAMLDGDNPPAVGQLVSYNLTKDNHGRPCAVNIRKPGDQVHKPTRKKSKTPLMLLGLMFLGVAANAVYLE